MRLLRTWQAIVITSLLTIHSTAYAVEIVLLQSVHEPFSLSSAENKPKGIFSDLVHYLLQDSGHSLKVLTVSQLRKMHLQNSNQYPYWISYTSKHHVTQDDDGYENGTGFFTSKFTSIPFQEAECVTVTNRFINFEELRNFEGKHIVTSLGADESIWKKALGVQKLTVSRATNDIAGIKTILYNRADVLVTLRTSANWAIKEVGAEKIPLQIQSCSFWPKDQFVLMMNKATKELVLDKLNTGIKAAIDNGALANIISKYTTTLN